MIDWTVVRAVSHKVILNVRSLLVIVRLNGLVRPHGVNSCEDSLKP